MTEQQKWFVGTVTKGRIARGSKSDRLTTYLKTADDEFVLRIAGGNPFVDSRLERLIGKKICCQGEVRDYTLIISKWHNVKDG
jgi:spore coat polysaccharide biosynthesis protein SpsF (cytidylyltransferase family)